MNNRLVRVVRGRRLDRNPLRRRTDRAQTIIWVGLLVLFAVVAPIAWNVATARVASLARHDRAVTLAIGHPVTAVTTAAAPEVPSSLYNSMTHSWVAARWTAPDGRHRTGNVEVGAGSPIGVVLTVWVDRDGRLIAPPVSVAASQAIALVAAIGTITALALLLALAGIAVTIALNRRRMATWKSGWAATEPRWNRQRW